MRREIFAAQVWAKLIAHQKKHLLIKPGDRILVAVSGGPDSVCLAHYLEALKRRIGFSVAWSHVHHGLRGRSADQDAAFVKKLGESFGIATKIIYVATRSAAKKRGQGIEDAARKLRYEALINEARKLKCNKVATAHHMDDQAETVLLNLIRGTKLSALAAMLPERKLSGKIWLIRPLLGIKRQEIIDYLKIHKLKYRIDETNFSNRYTRNWIRQEIIPMLERKNPKIREHLSAIAAQIQPFLPRLP